MKQLAPLKNNFTQVSRYNITQEDWKPFSFQRYHIKSCRDLLERVMPHGSAKWYLVRGNGLNPKTTQPQETLNSSSKDKVLLARLDCPIREELTDPQQNWAVQRGETEEAKTDRLIVTCLTTGGIL